MSTERPWDQEAGITKDPRGDIVEIKVRVRVDDIRKIERYIQENRCRHQDGQDVFSGRDVVTLSAIGAYVEFGIADYAIQCAKDVRAWEREDKLREVRAIMDRVAKGGDPEKRERADRYLNNVKEGAPINQVDELLGQLHQLADQQSVVGATLAQESQNQPESVRYYEPHPERDYERGDDR